MNHSNAVNLLLQIPNLLSYHNHPEFHLTSDQWSDLVTPVMVAQRECLLVRSFCL